MSGKACQLKSYFKNWLSLAGLLSGGARCSASGRPCFRLTQPPSVVLYSMTQLPSQRMAAALGGLRRFANASVIMARPSQCRLHWGPVTGIRDQPCSFHLPACQVICPRPQATQHGAPGCPLHCARERPFQRFADCCRKIITQGQLLRCHLRPFAFSRATAVCSQQNNKCTDNMLHPA